VPPQSGQFARAEVGEQFFALFRCEFSKASGSGGHGVMYPRRSFVDIDIARTSPAVRVMLLVPAAAPAPYDTQDQFGE
jgi:hypothetical protein